MPNTSDSINTPTKVPYSQLTNQRSNARNNISGLHDKKRGKKYSYFKISVITILCLSIVILLYIVLVQNPYFELKNVSYLQTNYKYHSIDELNSSIDSAKGKNIFSLDTEALAKKIKSKFPTIKKILFDKKLPNTVTVSIEEVELKYLMVCPKKVYYLSDLGEYTKKEDLKTTLQLSDVEIELMNGDKLISDVILSDEELNSVKQNVKSNSNDLLDEKIRDAKVVKYRNEIFAAYKKSFEEMPKTYDNKFGLNVISSLNCESYGENFEKFGMYREYLLSYNSLMQDSFFANMQILELKYDRFLVKVNDKLYMFSAKTSIDKQLKRFSVVKNNLEKINSDYTYIDLSQEKVVVI